MEKTQGIENSKMDPIFSMIPLSGLHESDVNPRRSMNDAKLQELTESIRVKGVLTPLLVRPDGTYYKNDPGGRTESCGRFYEIAAGHRRYRAAKEAGLQEVPAIVREMSDKDFLEIIVIENDQREDVNPLDQAKGYQRLIDTCGYDVPALAARVGRSESFIYQRLKLLELIPEAQKAFLEEKITAGHAILIARLQEKDQKTILEDLMEDREYLQSVRGLSRYIESKFHLDLNSASFSKKDADLVPEAGPCTTCPKRTGFIPQLFPDIKKKDTCTDPGCFNRKTEAYLANKIRELEEDSDEVLRLSDDYQRSYGEKKKPGDEPVYKSQWTEIGKKDTHCESVRKGIIVQGRERGKVVTVCADPECKTHGKDRYGQVDPKEKARRKAEEKKRRVESATRMRLIDGILENLPASLETEDLRLVTKTAYDRLWNEYQKKIVSRLGLEPKKEQYGQKNYRAPIEKYLKDANPATLNRFLMEMSLISLVETNAYGDNTKNKDLLEDIAYRHQVDVIRIRAEAKAELEDGKKKPKKLVEVLGKDKEKPARSRKEPVKIGKSRKKYNLDEILEENKKRVQMSAKAKGLGPCGAVLNEKGVCSHLADAAGDSSCDFKCCRLCEKECNGRCADAGEPKKTLKTGKKTKKSKSGVCRVCGCSEENACEGGCHWADETRTICSACVKGLGEE